MDQDNNSKQKIIVAFVMVAAIVIVALGVTFFKDKDSDATSDISSAASSNGTAPAQSSSSNSSATYKDGTYSASGTYLSPGGNEKIDVSLSIKDSVVTNSTINQTANNRNSAEYQAMFKQSYQSSVVGKALKDISLSRVSGSSLTSQGFNEALQSIKSKAKA